MDDDASDCWDTPFSSFVSLPGGTLMELAGELIPEPITPMLRQIGEALQKPIGQLTCGEVRLLVSQGVALSVLAAPAVAFAKAHPHADTGNYPGDFREAVMRHFNELCRHVPNSGQFLH